MALNYIPPTSWNDKGMNWDDPDPFNIDYIAAIQRAISERKYLHGGYSSLPSIAKKMSNKKEPVLNYIDYISFVYASPQIIFDASFLNTIVMEILNLSESFYDIEASSALNRLTTVRESINMSGEQLNLDYPVSGDLVLSQKNFLKNAKKWIDKLTVKSIHVYHLFKEKLCGWKWAEGFEESLQDAIDRLNDTPEKVYYPSDIYYPSDVIFAYSGSLGLGYDDYYASCAAYRYVELYNIHLAGSLIDKVRFLLGQYSKKVYPAGYEDCTDAVFDPCGEDFVDSKLVFLDQGIYDKGANLNLTFGSDNIPRTARPRDPEGLIDDPNIMVPEYEIYYRSTRGYETAFYFLGDFGIEGGFKFRA